MSAWKIVTRELYAAGRPMRADEFPQNWAASDPARALHQARILGLVEVKRHHYTWAWHLTQHGRDWCAGLVEIRYLKPMNRGGRRRIGATWLAPLGVV